LGPLGPPRPLGPSTGPGCGPEGGRFPWALDPEPVWPAAFLVAARAVVAAGRGAWRAPSWSRLAAGLVGRRVGCGAGGFGGSCRPFTVPVRPVAAPEAPGGALHGPLTWAYAPRVSSPRGQYRAGRSTPEALLSARSAASPQPHKEQRLIDRCTGSPTRRGEFAGRMPSNRRTLVCPSRGRRAFQLRLLNTGPKTPPSIGRTPRAAVRGGDLAS